MSNLFELASRKAFRFTSNRGHLTTEDLWSLNLTALDTIAVSIDDAIQKAKGKSFISKKTTASSDLEAQLEIVKHIIGVKQAETEASKLRTERAAKKAQLEQILLNKQTDALHGLSIEDLQKQIAELS